MQSQPRQDVIEEEDLPAGWISTKLELCVDILDSQRVPVNSDKRQERLGNIPYYGATGQVGWIDDFLFDEQLLLVGEDGAPFLDKSKTIAFLINGKSWVNNHAHVLKAIEKVTSNTFLKHYLNQFDFREYVNGTTRLKLTQEALRRIAVKLPPFAEQKRIVAKLEQLLGKVEDCRERLAKIPQILKRFRQAVLAAACSGRLTEDWREENPDVESAEELVKRIAHSKIAIQRSESSNWISIVVEDLFDSFSGGTPNKNQPQYWNGSVPWVSSGDVKSDEIESGELFITEEGLKNSATKLCSSNSVIVVVRSGILKHTLPVALVKNKLAINQDIKCFDSGNRDINYWLFLNLKAFQNQILGLNREGTTVQSVKSETLKKWCLSLPPLAEQQEIVRRVEGLFRLADRIEERYQKAKACVEQITQAILAKAFRGELVPQDPNDEPASVLLERIRQERESSQPGKKKRRKV